MVNEIETPYLIHHEPIMECVDFEEIPLVPIYILDRRTAPWDDCFGRPLCVILEVAEAEKHGLNASTYLTFQLGEFGIYELPTIMWRDRETGSNIMDKIVSGELLAYYAENDFVNHEYSGEVPLIIGKNNGEQCFVAVNDNIERIIDKHNDDEGIDWREFEWNNFKNRED